MLREWADKNPPHAWPIEHFLHERIRSASWLQLKNAHYREAAFNAVLALNDILREKAEASCDEDGAALARAAFSSKKPLLVVGSLETRNGISKQEGLGSMIAGLMLWLRNPHAHTLKERTDATKAVRVMLTASLLADELAKTVAIGAVESSKSHPVK